MVLSIIAYSLSASAAKGSNTLCQMPFWAQRLNRRWLFFPSPKRSGRDAMGRAVRAWHHRRCKQTHGGAPCRR